MKRNILRYFFKPQSTSTSLFQNISKAIAALSLCQFIGVKKAFLECISEKIQKMQQNTPKYFSEATKAKAQVKFIGYVEPKLNRKYSAESFSNGFQISRGSVSCTFIVSEI